MTSGRSAGTVRGRGVGRALAQGTAGVPARGAAGSVPGLDQLCLDLLTFQGNLPDCLGNLALLCWEEQCLQFFFFFWHRAV